MDQSIQKDMYSKNRSNGAQDRYAYRDLMTDVVIQHLGTDQRVRIKCRDYVRRISVYRSRVAVQLPDRIIIYDPDPSQDADSMQYKRDRKSVV